MPDNGSLSPLRERYARRMLIACIAASVDAMDKAERITDPALRAQALERGLESVHSLSEAQDSE